MSRRMSNGCGDDKVESDSDPDCDTDSYSKLTRMWREIRPMGASGG